MGAITLHTLSDKRLLEKISCNRNVYAFLLFIIDNIQDWSRAFKPDKKHPNYHLIHFSNNEDKRIILDYSLTSDSWSDEMKVDVHKFINSKKQILNKPARFNHKGWGIEIKIKFHMLREDKPLKVVCQI